MPEIIDPKQFGIPLRTQIIQISKNHLAILINRSSRIIMKDGIRIADYAARIKKVKPAATISFQTSAPVCSRTKDFLEKEGINVSRINE